MRYILLLITILFFSGSIYAQSGEAAITSRQIKKQRKENVKASKRAAKYGKKRHMSIQDKATRKRMKRNLRESNKRNKALRR